MISMKKYRRTAIILLFIMAFTFCMPIMAEANVVTDAVTDAVTDVIDTVKEDVGNAFESAIAGLLDFVNRVIIYIFGFGGFKDLSQLVFASGLSEAQKDALPWQPSQVPYIIAFYKGLSLAVMPIYALLIGVSGYKFLAGALNPSERAEAKDSVMRLFYGLLIILLAPYLVEILMKSSLFLTSVIAQAFGSIGNVSDLQALNVDILESNSITTGSVLGTVFVKIMFGLMFVYFNILYIIRMVGITVMLIFTPLMAIWWIINKNTTAVAVWLGELASNAFMPVAHALVLCVIMLLADVKNVSQDGSWVTILIMLYALVPLAEALRNSMQSIFTRAAGFSEEGTAMRAIGGIFGGISSVARVGKATLGNGKTISNLSNSFANSSRLGITPSSPTSNGVKMATPKRQPTANSGYRQATTSVNAANQQVAQKAPVNTTSVNMSQQMPQMAASNQIAVDPSRQPVSMPSKSIALNSGTAKLYNPPSRNAMATKTATMTTAAKAGNIAGAAVKLAAIPAMMVAGAVPGGDKIIKTGTAIAHQTAITGTTTAVAAGQVARAYSQNRNMGQALQQVTGTADRRQAVTRIATAALSDKPMQHAQQQYQVKKQYRSPHRMVIGAHTTHIPARYRVSEQKTGIKKPPKPPEIPGGSGGGREYINWRDKSVTPRQRWVLNEYGVNRPGLNRGSASDIIGSVYTKLP